MEATHNKSAEDYELSTIRFSHYNEKARWVLDYFQIPYHERPYLPGLQALPVYLETKKYNATTKADSVSSQYSTPVLVEKNSKKIVCDSTDIMHHLDAMYSVPDSTQGTRSQKLTLYPEAHKSAIFELETRLHDILGPTTRAMVYIYVISDPKLSKQLAWDNFGFSFQTLLFDCLFGFYKKRVMKRLGATEDKAESLLEDARKEFEHISELLTKNGTGFIIGDRFSAVDLSFACMAAPLLLVQAEEGYGAKSPHYNDVSIEYGKIVQEMRNSIAGRHALKMFKEHRGERIIPCQPEILSSKENNSTRRSTFELASIFIIFGLILILIYIVYSRNFNM